MILCGFFLPSFGEIEKSQTKNLDKTKQKATNIKTEKKISKKDVDLYAVPKAEIQIEKGQILGLDDCIKIALKNSPIIKKYENELQATKSAVGVAKSDYFPVLSAGTGYYLTTSKYSNQPTSHGTNEYDAYVGLKQMIYNFGKSNANIRMRKFYQISANYELEDIIVITIFNVKQAYYKVLAAKTAVDVNKEYLKINEYQYNRTKAYFDEGLKSRIDVVNASVTLSDSKITLIESENLYEEAVISLNNEMYVAYAPDYKISFAEKFNTKRNYADMSLVNVSDKENFSNIPQGEKGAVFKSIVQRNNVLKDYKLKNYPYTMQQCLNMAYKNRSDMKAYINVYKAMQEALLYAKRSYYPQLNGSAGYDYMRGGGYYKNGANLYLGLDFPSINIMGIKYEIDKAKAELAYALNEVDLVKQNVYFDVQTAYVNMIQLEKQIPLMNLRVQQTLENVELANGRYEVGLGNFLEVQNANVNYNKAQLNYVSLIYNYNVAKATLAKVVEFTPEEQIK